MVAPQADPGGFRGTASGPSGSRSMVLASALAGAVLGAAGLAWWLLSEAEKRRLHARQQRVLRLSRYQESGGALDGVPPARFAASPTEQELHSKVHQLNEAIDDVRRQLEALATGR
ncbi:MULTISPECIES: hypothetical protein [Aphanothece]|uniref:hypothetical protein n=1 Tax=Aphanothece TaxID=1121 RepID=UPI0039849C52